MLCTNEWPVDSGILNGASPLDLIIHTPSMHETFLERDSMFARKVKREGEVLYEKGN